MKSTMKAICHFMDNTSEMIDVASSEHGNIITASLSKELLKNKKIRNVDFCPDMLTADSSDNGYMFYPVNCSTGVVLCNFKPGEDSELVTDIAIMPCFGMHKGEDSLFAIMKSMECESHIVVRLKDGRYTAHVRVELCGDDPYEDIVVDYYKMPDATYSDMARVYRDYQISEKGCVPLKERARHNKYLDYAANSMELRIRMGWKPVPTPVMHQTPETEPSLKVVCDLDKINAILDEMKAQHVERAEICLVGWSQGGHDGRFPQQVPSDERYGGDEKLIALIKKAQSLGYQIVVHTNSVCAYEIADNFDADTLTKSRNPDGSISIYRRMGYVRSGGLSGGEPFLLCAHKAFDPYAKVDLPKVSAYGFRGLHFIDEITCCVPQRCYDPTHPVNRREAIEWYRKCAILSRELFGGFQSEGWFDFINSDVDYIMYTNFVLDISKRNHPLMDEGIPFWQLVYHGIVLSNPGSETVNYVLKQPYEHLKFIEYGGRPLMYYYSKFGEKKNWMGDVDLICDTPEDLRKSVAALKEAYDEFEPLRRLQYEFMDNHEKIADNIYRITYSNGTVIIVDYNKGTYEVKDAAD